MLCSRCMRWVNAKPAFGSTFAAGHLSRSPRFLVNGNAGAAWAQVKCGLDNLKALCLCESALTENLPRLGLSFPASTLMAVDLPMPLVPTRPSTCPGRGVGSLHVLPLITQVTGAMNMLVMAQQWRMHGSSAHTQQPTVSPVALA